MTTEIVNQDVKPCAETKRPEFVPAADLHETLDAYHLEISLPGATEESLSLKVEDRVLRVEADVTVEAPENYEPVYRGYVGGLFRRAFRLSDEVDVTRIAAKLDQGVLTVSLPKREEAKARKIEVNSGR